MTEKTFCKRCHGSGGWCEWSGWDDEMEKDIFEDFYECPDCDGTGEVEYHSKSEMKRIETLADQSGREAVGMASCGVPLSGHTCTCRNPEGG